MSEKLSIWLITVGEPLPLEGNVDRLWRTGLLAEILSDRGHEVLWWTSTVDHFRKTFFVEGEPRVSSRAGVPIQFLAGCLYRQNISLRRLVNHAQVAQRFAQLARLERRPDLVLCSFPTIELSREAVRFAKTIGAASVLDVRDLWPDIFLDVVPSFAKWFAKFALTRSFRDARVALAGCDAVLAASDAYLQWGLAKGLRTATEKDRVFPLGYRPTAWSADDARTVERRLRAGRGLPDVPFVTFAGTFGRTYDLKTVIEAERLLRGRFGLGVRFLVCGTGEREDEWRSLASGGSVTFLGWLSAGELAYVLSKSTLGLAAYAAGAPQGIPNKVIEYLSASLPVLCSLPGEARLLLEAAGCGVYYRAADANSLAEAVRSVLADQARIAEMRAAARRMFSDRFSSATVYAEMADHLEWIALGRPGRRA